jgi:hypothetical protein
LCKQNKEFIKREIDKRKIYITIETDPDTIEGDFIHSLSVSQRKPKKMFSDFLEVHKFELIRYNVNKIYVVLNYTDHVRDIQIFTDRSSAENYFYDKSEMEINRFRDTDTDNNRLEISDDDHFKVAVYDQDDTLVSSWELFILDKSF